MERGRDSGREEGRDGEGSDEGRRDMMGGSR